MHQSTSLLSAAQADSYSNEYGINLELAERLCAFENYFCKYALLVLIPKPLGPDLSKSSQRVAQDSEDIYDNVRPRPQQTTAWQPRRSLTTVTGWINIGERELLA